METPGECWARIKGRKVVEGKSYLQASMVTLALADGNSTTAKIVAYCDDMPELGLNSTRVLAVLKRMALSGLVVPYIEPMPSGQRPWRWRFYLASDLAGDDFEPTSGCLSLEEVNARFDGDEEDTTNVVDWLK